MERPRHQFFARPALTRDQYRSAAVRHLFDLGVDLLHGGAFPDEVMEGIPVHYLGAEVAHFSFQIVRLERAGDDDAKFLDVERFRQVIRCAELHRVHGGLHRFGPGQHDDGNRAVFRPHGLQHGQPVGSRHDHVQEYQIGRFASEEIQSFLSVLRRDDVLGGFQDHLL